MNPDPAEPHETLDAASDERPSKTQRKKEMTALQVLGARLVKLNAGQLQQLALPEKLLEAVAAAQKITAHEARRRQMQYIGKLMRQIDAAPLERALDDLTGDSRAAVALMHRCERWRDRLLEDDGALTDLLHELAREHHATDVQPLRAMIRAARREHEVGQPPKHARELYRLLHDLLGGDRADAGT